MLFSTSFILFLSDFFVWDNYFLFMWMCDWRKSFFSWFFGGVFVRIFKFILPFRFDQSLEDSLCTRKEFNDRWDYIKFEWWSFGLHISMPISSKYSIMSISISVWYSYSGIKDFFAFLNFLSDSLHSSNSSKQESFGFLCKSPSRKL